MAAAPLINPRFPPRPVWTMLMQRIPSAEAIRQTDCMTLPVLHGCGHIRADACCAGPMRRHSAGRPDRDRKAEENGEPRRDFSQNGRYARLNRSRFQGIDAGHQQDIAQDIEN